MFIAVHTHIGRTLKILRYWILFSALCECRQILNGFFLLAKAINELCKDLLLNYSQTKQDLIAISGMPRKRSIKKTFDYILVDNMM